MTQAPQPAPNRKEDGSIDPSVTKPIPSPAVWADRQLEERLLRTLDDGDRDTVANLVTVHFSLHQWDVVRHLVTTYANMADQLNDVKRVRDQLSLNCDFLQTHLDEVHNALCPGQDGTWQMRAEQAAAAAAVAGQSSGADVIRSIERARDQWEAMFHEIDQCKRRMTAAYDRCVNPKELLARFSQALAAHEALITQVVAVLRKMDAMGGVEESRQQVAQAGVAVLETFDVLMRLMNQIDPDHEGDDGDDK